MLRSTLECQCSTISSLSSKRKSKIFAKLFEYPSIVSAFPSSAHPKVPYAQEGALTKIDGSIILWIWFVLSRYISGRPDKLPWGLPCRYRLAGRSKSDTRIKGLQIVNSKAQGRVSCIARTSHAYLLKSGYAFEATSADGIVFSSPVIRIFDE